MMDFLELRRELLSRFDGVAQVYAIPPDRIELDVSTNLEKEERIKLIEGLGFTDNGDSIPDSYKCGSITVVFFNGSLGTFRSKTNF